MEPARRFLEGGAECEEPGSGQLRAVWVGTGRGHSVEEEALRKCRMLTTDWGDATCSVVESSTPGILLRVQGQGPFLDCSNIRC